MSQAVTCPYCNSVLSVTALRDGKETCPRCGEILPETVTRLLEGGNGAGQPAAETSPASGSKRPSNRKVALLILAGMFVVAAGALAFMLATQPQRRDRDPSDPDPLYFLPRGTN